MEHTHPALEHKYMHAMTHEAMMHFSVEKKITYTSVQPC